MHDTSYYCWMHGERQQWSDSSKNIEIYLYKKLPRNLESLAVLMLACPWSNARRVKQHQLVQGKPGWVSWSIGMSHNPLQTTPLQFSRLPKKIVNQSRSHMIDHYLSRTSWLVIANHVHHCHAWSTITCVVINRDDITNHSTAIKLYMLSLLGNHHPWWSTYSASSITGISFKPYHLWSKIILVKLAIKQPLSTCDSSISHGSYRLVDGQLMVLGARNFGKRTCGASPNPPGSCGHPRQYWCLPWPQQWVNHGWRTIGVMVRWLL